MDNFDPGSWLAIGPMIAVIVTALVVMLLHALKASVPFQAGASVVGLFAAAFTTITAAGAEGTLTFPAAPTGVSNVLSVAYVQLDGYAAFFFIIFCFVSLATCLVAGPYLKVYRARLGEFYATVLLATFGMMVMAASRDLLILYLGLETMSLAAYVLAGLFIDRAKSREAALKYFLTGAFGSALFLYGAAFLYGATGTISYAGIGATISAAPHPTYAVVGAGLLLSGFAFKVAAVPFHMWAPDVYQGAPTPVSGLMAVGVKAAAFAALTKIVMTSLTPIDGPWITWMLYLLAIFTMAWGNIAAVAQKNIKRLLAYSSVAHAGYLLIAVTVHNELSMPAILVYLASYAFMTLGAFSVVMLLEKQGERHLEIDNYAGLGKRHPYLAVAMTVFLVSLAGIPPTLGFIGKWYIFSAAITRGYVMLAIIGILTSVVSVYYYMRVVYVMFMKDSPEDAEQAASVESKNYTARVVAFGFAAMILLLGLFPTHIIEFARLAGN